MSSVKAFITIPWFLPAFRGGGPIRSVANLVEQYQNAEFYIFTGVNDVDGTLYMEDETDCWRRWNDHTQIWYGDPAHVRHNLKIQLKSVKPDILFVIGLFSVSYNILPILYGKSSRVIVSARGMLHTEALRQKKWKKKFFLYFLRYTTRNPRFFFHATNDQERNYIHQNLHIRNERIFVAGNYPTFYGHQNLPQKLPGQLRMVSIALISPMKNLLCVLTGLTQTDDVIVYDIYGAIKDEKYWEMCLSIIKKLPDNISVNYRGPVSPVDVKKTLCDYHVFVLPSKSENFGHAIFEALSAGRPVITSHGTPFNHLEDEACGLNVDAESADEMTRGITFFSGMNDTQLQRWSQNATRFASVFRDQKTLENAHDNMFGVV